MGGEYNGGDSFQTGFQNQGQTGNGGANNGAVYEQGGNYSSSQGPLNGVPASPNQVKAAEADAAREAALAQAKVAQQAALAKAAQRAAAPVVKVTPKSAPAPAPKVPKAAPVAAVSPPRTVGGSTKEGHVGNKPVPKGPVSVPKPQPAPTPVVKKNVSGSPDDRQITKSATPSRTLYVAPDGTVRQASLAGSAQMPADYHPVIHYGSTLAQAPSKGTSVVNNSPSWASAYQSVFSSGHPSNSSSAPAPINPTRVTLQQSVDQHAAQGRPVAPPSSPGAPALGQPGQVFVQEVNARGEPITAPALSIKDQVAGKSQTASAAIRELLGATEGTDRGRGYNEVIGYGKFGQPPKDLTSMTLGEVYKYQKEVVKSGAPSGAVGRYQFINKTLKSVAKAEGFNNDTVFTPAVQDQLANHQLEARGLSSYLSGSITQDTFMNRLSQEWASLPDPYNGGDSHYQGQSAVGLDKVISVLGTF